MARRMAQGDKSRSSSCYHRCCLIILLVSGIVRLASGQTLQNASSGESELTLPVIPRAPQRRLQGSGPESQLNVLRPEGAVGAFIDSLKGNDAAFHVTLGQGRLLTLKRDIAGQEGSGYVAVGDPTVIDFEVLPNPRMIRVLGLRAGVTDLSVTTFDDESYSFEVHVGYDLELLEARLRQTFPSAYLRLAQLREHVIVEGQARSPAEVTRIIETIEAFLRSVQVPRQTQGQQAIDAGLDATNEARGDSSQPENGAQAPVRGRPTGPQAGPETGGRPTTQASLAQAQVINLIRVPGVQQVLLKVRIAELDRTAMRDIGADILGIDPDSGKILGTRIGGANVAADAIAGLLSDEGMEAATGLVGSASSALGTSSTAFGIFPGSDLAVVLRALRVNSVLNILAEPNLITMSGHRANFLAGGEFPIPVSQGAGVGNNTVTVEFREFGVRLDFLPVVLDDDRIRLSVTPEVSTIDFSLGTTLVVGGDPVPGLNTRRANTTVQLREGQTLAMAGLLQVELDGQTSRIPGLGDLPILGPLFSNTSHRRTEKELLVLVTPHLIRPMEEDQVPALPGANVEDPTDLELYLGNKYEGRTGSRHRSTTHYGFFGPAHLIDFHHKFIHGPVGYAP